jgi:hypothetical protein
MVVMFIALPNGGESIPGGNHSVEHQQRAKAKQWGREQVPDDLNHGF